MHFHLPKPLHGWRAFAGEVGIIVLGVLIALGLGQAVEAWQAKRSGDQTLQALSSEAVVMATNATERVALNQCGNNRLKELAARLSTTKDRWSADVLPPSPYALQIMLPSVYRVPYRPMRTDNWETAKSTGHLNLLSRAQAESFAKLYVLAERFRQLEDEEAELAPQLNILGFDQTLDNASRLQALRTVARLDYLNAAVKGTSQQIIASAKELHLSFDRAAVSSDLSSRIHKEQSVRGACVANVQIAF